MEVWMKASEERTAYWKQQVEAFEKSGMSRIAFCEQNQLKIYGLDYWRRRFSEPIRAGADAKTSGWIPLQVKDNAAQEKAESICLRIGKVEIEISRGFDQELLAEVLRVVGPAC